MNQIQYAAQQLIAARQQHQSVLLTGHGQPSSPEQAYAMQDAVAAELWQSKGIAAWKVGAASPEAMPNCAPIGRPLLYPSNTILAAGDFFLRGIEGELAFTIGQDLPPLKAPYQREQLAEAIRSVQPAIEIVDSRLQGDYAALDPLAKLADFQSNGALILGVASTDWRHIDPSTQGASLLVDEQTIVSSQGGNVAKDLLRLLTWLANHLAERCGGLKAGDVVTTGTFTGLHFVPESCTVRVCFEALGEVAVQFSPGRSTKD